MSYPFAFSIALTTSDTGLTLYGQLVDTAGTNVGAQITTGFTEIGSGNYLLSVTAVPNNHRGGLEIYNNANDALLAFGAINPEETSH